MQSHLWAECTFDVMVCETGQVYHSWAGFRVHPKKLQDLNKFLRNITLGNFRYSMSTYKGTISRHVVGLLWGVCVGGGGSLSDP